MPTTLAPERADEIITRWLDGTDPVDGWDSPAGPLFMSGKYAEYEITLTGGGGVPFPSGGVTGCGQCTGSICRECF